MKPPVGFLLVVAVTQVVEQWHFVWAGWVLNHGTILGFFQFRIGVNLISLVVVLFLITCIRTIHTLPSSFLSSFTIVKFINCKFNQAKGKNKIQIEAGKISYLKKAQMKQTPYHLGPFTQRIMFLWNVFFKRCPCQGRTWNLFGFRLFSLSKAAP